jgi:D-sedoheptulose 7-phosphate isomerase
MNSLVRSVFEESILVKQECIKSSIHQIEDMGNEIFKLIMRGNKIMLCGNGGSAADAQHLAAEMLIRLRPNYNREGVAAIALSQDISTITACGNDFGYDVLYERLIKTLGNKGDCLIAISTSGNSKNVVLAMKAAKKMNIKVFGFLGSDGGDALTLCDKVFLVPSKNTGRIQEAHITAGHALMEYIEDRLIESNYLHLQK